MSRWPGPLPPPRTPTPERLARFVPSEWPGAARVDQWREACLEWLRADSSRRLSFGEHGDAVDVIRESARLKLAGAQ
jgi:hypothetical protein